MTILSTVVALATTPYLLKTLGEASYGVLGTLTLVTSYLLNLEFGFGYATIRFLAVESAQGRREAERTVANAAHTAFTVAGVAGAVMMASLAGLLVNHVFLVPTDLRPDSQLAFILGALALYASFRSTAYAMMIQAKGHLGRLSALRLVTAMASAVGSVVVVALGGRLLAVVAIQTGLAWGGMMAVAALARRTLGLAPVLQVHPPTLKRMASYGVYSFLAGISYQMMLTGPAAVLATRVSSAELPAYTIPATILQRLVQLVVAASAAFFPFASAASSDAHGRLAQVYRSNVRLQWLLIGPVAGFLAAFGETLLRTWISADFAQRAAMPLTLLAVTALLISASSPAADVARAMDRIGWVLAFTTVAAILGVALAFPLSAHAGSAGAAASLTLAVGAASLPFAVIVSSRLMGLTLKMLADDLVRPLAAVVVLSAAWMLVARQEGGLGPAAVSGLVFGALYAIGAFRWLLSSEERQALQSAAGLRSRRGEKPA